MKLLEAEPALAPPAPQPEAPAPEAPAPAEAPRACTACGAALEPEQDWCLACGTAAPGRLAGRPGWRSALAIALAATLLVAGGVAAAYAALNDDAAREASAPASADIAPVATPTPQTPAAEQPPVQATTPQDLPKVSSGQSGAGGAPPATPVATTTAPTTSVPAQDQPTAQPDQTPATTTPAAEPAPQPIEVSKDAGDVYDPLGRARNAGDPVKALDGDPSTDWAFSSSVPEQPGVGYVVRLDKARGIQEIRLQTSTPGFKVEIYATDEARPPPQITDARWAHIRDRAEVKARQRIVLGKGTSRYRTLLLWFTAPPSAGDRIRLTELRLLG
jgi:hypothetical protein